MCGRPLKSLLPLQRPAGQATIDLSDESIESRGSHALAAVIRSMSGNLHCDRAVALDQVCRLVIDPFDSDYSDMYSFCHIFCHQVRGVVKAVLKGGMEEHSLANRFRVLSK